MKSIEKIGTDWDFIIKKQLVRKINVLAKKYQKTIKKRRKYWLIEI